MPKRTDPAVRLLRKTEITGTCWLWSGWTNNWGYGEMMMPDGQHGKAAMAHRVAYEIWNGSIPVGYEVDHLCRVRNCVNPAHLEAVTYQENNRRRSILITHCPQGHLYEPRNTRLSKAGARYCLDCKRERMANGRWKVITVD